MIVFPIGFFFAKVQNVRCHVSFRGVYWKARDFSLLWTRKLQIFPNHLYDFGGLEPQKSWIWANYSDLTRPQPKWWFSKGNPTISGKSRLRLVKYYNLARWMVWNSFFFYSCSTQKGCQLFGSMLIKRRTVKRNSETLKTYPSSSWSILDFRNSKTEPTTIIYYLLWIL